MTHRPLRLTSLVLVLQFSTTASVRAAPLVLADDGKPLASIVIPDAPAPAVKLAAAELQHHVELATGAKLPIAFESQAPADSPAIHLGLTRRAISQIVEIDRLNPFQSVLRRIDDELFLLGRDAPPPKSPGPGIEYVDGHSGQALAFDGTRGLLDFPNFPFPDAGGAFDCWILLPDTPSPRHGAIMRIDREGAATRPAQGAPAVKLWTFHSLTVLPNSRQVSAVTAVGDVRHEITSPNLAPGWRHLRFEFSAARNKATLFVDAAAVGTSPYAATECAGNTLTLGAVLTANPAAPANPLLATLDEISLTRADEGAGASLLQLPCDDGSGFPIDLSSSPDRVPPVDPFEPHGTLQAVHEFLDRTLKCRWYLPGDVGLTLEPTKRLVVRNLNDVWAPAMAHRAMANLGGMFHADRTLQIPQRSIDLWKLRNGIGGEPFVANHSFDSIYSRFLTSRPAWFAQGYPNQPRPPQPCFSNEELLAQVTADARACFDGQPPEGALVAGDYFPVVPLDNGFFCRCEKCLPKWESTQRASPHFSHGQHSDYVFEFVARVAENLKQSHPDRRISTLAYASYARPPERIKLPDNVSLQICVSDRIPWHVANDANQRAILKEWQTARSLEHDFLWLYYCFPAFDATHGPFTPFPGYSARRLQERFTHYGSLGVRGVFFEHSSQFQQSVWLDLPDLYLALRRARHPVERPEKQLAEFFDDFYDSASKPMSDAYRLLESAYSTPTSYPLNVRTAPGQQRQTEALVRQQLATPTRMKELSRLIAAARSRRPSPRALERIALFEAAVFTPLAAKPR